MRVSRSGQEEGEGKKKIAIPQEVIDQSRSDREAFFELIELAWLENAPRKVRTKKK